MKKILVLASMFVASIASGQEATCRTSLMPAFPPEQAVQACKKLNSSIATDLIVGTSGKTLSLQEGTAASACMGVATPNGNTNVTVTTTCAVTGGRIFYTRLGAITNMGVITTTTAPAGASFTFASIGASDTLASSVVWMIVKESA